ncbi:MAG: DEAD/DEAH box helicase [Caldilineaceae bacterium]|nr:DEAD/DEAH box helicase [Caldilineaceae bacterium]
MLRLDPQGRGGVRLSTRWQDRFHNYLGLTIRGFPNLFMIHGPGSPGVFYNMPPRRRAADGLDRPLHGAHEDRGCGRAEPTRELATQIADSFVAYGRHTHLTYACVYGGVSQFHQVRALQRGVDVLIATPGRLLDHFERGKLLLTGISIMVVDEADRMLDMGFIPDIEFICSKLPETRQTMLFSATMPAPIEKLAKKFKIDLDAPESLALRPSLPAWRRQHIGSVRS